MKRIEDKIDIIVEKIGNMDVTLAKQEQQIGYHIKRTDLLEQLVAPAVKLAADVQGIKKTGKLVAAVVGTLAAILKILHSFFH